MGSAARVRLDVIDDGGQVVQKRGSISPPSEIVVGERSSVSLLSREPFQEAQRGREDYGAVAPPTEPAVAAEDAHL